jgi:hypothetical protein
MKKRINPDRMIQTIQEYFKGSLSKPNLKNLSLATIAMAKSDRLKINEIARNLPVDVGNQKAKQTRLLRFLNNNLPLDDMMFSWSNLVFQRVYGNSENTLRENTLDDTIIILVDGVELMYGYKAFVAAIPFRKRAIPIAFKVYTNQQIKDMIYPSENIIIWNFMDIVIDTVKMIIPNRKTIFVFDRGFADEKLMNYMNYFDSNYIIRVPKNCGIVGMEYKGKLASFSHFGYFRDMYYHIKKQVKVNLYSAKNPSDDSDPYFVVSNIDDILGLLYKKRMQIEEAFRDLKSLFGFKELLLKDIGQVRFETIFLLVIISMGMIVILYEKSGYRWSKYYNTKSRKEYSLIRVIKEKLRDSWINLRLDPLFTLDNARFYEV